MEILSQDEINKLPAATDSGVNSSGPDIPETAEETIKFCDFARPESFSGRQLREK